MDPFSLGRLCVERGHLTDAQLEQALALQREGEEWRRLGEILLTEGHLTGVVLANLLSIQEAMRRSEEQDETAGAQPEPAPEPPPPTELGWLVREARSCGARGIVLGVGLPPVFRGAGQTELLEGPPLDTHQIHKLLGEALPEELILDLERDGATARVARLPGGDRVRVTLYRSAGGTGAALRLLPGAAPQLEHLGLPAGTRELVAGSGLVLVTGEGRSTTLAALVARALAERPRHAVFVEPHPELPVAGDDSLVTRLGLEEPGRLLSLDADLVAFDPLHDRAGAETALSAAESGALVFATLPTGGALATVERFVDACDDAESGRERLAAVLHGIVSQRLFSSIDGGPTAVAAELLLATPGVANLVREGRFSQIPTVLHTSRSAGMCALEDSLARLCRKGFISAQQAVAAANEPDRLRSLTRKEASHA